MCFIEFCAACFACEQGVLQQQQQQQQAKMRSLPLRGHVGFDSLPDQLVNKSVTEGFTFNVICIGLFGTSKCCALKCYLFIVVHPTVS